MVVGHAGPSVGAYEHFHCYVPLWLLTPGKRLWLKELSAERVEAAFAGLLRRPWGLLCMLSNNNMIWWFSHGSDCYLRYLDAVLQYWTALDAEGTRYSDVSCVPEPLWNVALPVRKAMVRAGMPVELIRSRSNFPASAVAKFLEIASRADRSSSLLSTGTSLERVKQPASEDIDLPAKRTSPAERDLETSGTWMSEQMMAAIQANDPAGKCSSWLKLGSPSTRIIV